MLKEARDEQKDAALKEKIGAGLSFIPDFAIQIEPFGIGGAITFGGTALSRGMSFWASFARSEADRLTYEAGQAAKVGSYSWRQQGWEFQSNLAAAEINQVWKQLRAAQIREFVTEREWTNHQRQIRHAEDIEHFLTVEKDGKKANQAFYAWMKREVKSLYAQYFQFAFDVAKRAERALQHELGDSKVSFLNFGYLSGREGLLAGEKLYLDLKRMDVAYHEQNRREYELTRNVSLLQVAPRALLQLRRTGKCTVVLPEELFDHGCPGHYFRRIKTVSLSIPAVVGPYASVNCTLTLLKSSIRVNALLRDGNYVREDAEDSRFSDHFGSMQSVVTSSGQNDPGLFETNLRDERYLPFEGSGVISEWKLELAAPDVASFHYGTIADVVLHVRYTAREGGELLRAKAVENLRTCIAEARSAGSVRLFSVRQEFPTEWARFKSAAADPTTALFPLALVLRPEHYPFWSEDRLELSTRVEFFAAANEVVPEIPVRVTQGSAESDAKLARDTVAFGGLNVGRLKGELPTPKGEFSVAIGTNALQDLWMAINWGTVAEDTP